MFTGKEDVNRSAFPQVRMATLSEIGTHATIGAAMGPVRTDERTLAEEVIDIYLRAGMLLGSRPRFLLLRAVDQGRSHRSEPAMAGP
jgi:hypothetical protein